MEHSIKIQNAHAYCAGFEVYAILCEAVDASAILLSVNKRLELLSLSARFKVEDFYATPQDKGSIVQSRLSAVMNELKAVHPLSVAAHFILPINGFLTLARNQRHLFASIGQSLDNVKLPELYKESLESLRGLTDEDSISNAEIVDGGKAWLNGLYNHFLSESVSSKQNVFDSIEIKPGAFGLKIDVKQLLQQIIQRFRTKSQSG